MNHHENWSLINLQISDQGATKANVEKQKKITAAKLSWTLFVSVLFVRVIFWQNLNVTPSQKG